MKKSQTKLIKFIKNNKKKFIVLFFAILFLFGLFYVKDVGANFDEKTEQYILKMNIYEYVRHYSSDNDIAKYYANSGLEPISTNIERDHGIAPYYIFAPLLTLDKVSENVLSMAWHIYTYMLFFLGVIFLYLLVDLLFKNKKLALLMALFLFFSPRMFVDGMCNNKDCVIMSLGIVSMYFGVKFIKEKNIRNALLFGLTSAFICNIKITGAFIYVMLGLLYLADLTIHKKWNKKNFLLGVLAIASCVIPYIILTPAIWGNGMHLIQFIKYNLVNSTKFSRWNGKIFFEGKFYQNATNPLPWYYLPKLIAITSPIHVVILAILSLIIVIKKIVQTKKLNEINFYYLAFFLITVVPLTLAMISKPNVYNGWRHFYFLYGAIMMISAYGLYYLLKNKKLKNITLCLVGLSLIWNVVYIAYNGVFSTMYYNFLAGGKVEQRYETDYYSITTKRVLKNIAINYCQKGCYIYGKEFFDTYGLNVAKVFLANKYKEKMTFIETVEEAEKLHNEGIDIIYYANLSYDRSSYKGYKLLEEKKFLNNRYYAVYLKEGKK